MRSAGSGHPPSMTSSTACGFLAFGLVTVLGGCGDDAGGADPITGEGIFYALSSASVLADTLREDGSPLRYPRRALDGFGRELLLAARLRDRFYAPGFARRMVRYASRSRAIRRVLADLVLGDQGYAGLKRRLIRAAPRFLVESALHRLLPAA